MVDPTNITRYYQNQQELEEVLLFWVCAAGKNGVTASRCLESLLLSIEKNIRRKRRSPFYSIKHYLGVRSPNNEGRWCGLLAEDMKSHGIGCYNSKAKTFIELMRRDFNLKSVTRDELGSIWGIGMKTASCFIMHSRPDATCAGLDTHVLKYLRDQGIEAPSSTPTSRKKYLELEQKFLGLVPPTKTPAEFDLEVWLEYSGHRRV